MLALADIGAAADVSPLPIITQDAQLFHQHTVLALNSDGKPIGFPPKRVTAAEAVMGMLTGKFIVLADSPVVARAQRAKLTVPSVVMYRDFVPEGQPHQIAGLTPRNLYVRDQRRCVYTNRVLSLRHERPELQASVDHVFPKSKAKSLEEANTWLNWVLAAARRNSDKSDRLLKHLDRRMRIRPWAPRLGDLLWLMLHDGTSSIPEDWRWHLDARCSSELQDILEMDRRWRA